MNSAIETFDLQKSFAGTKAVRGIDLQVQRGIVYGLLGPNGAGKTTTIRMLTTLLKPSGGSARVLGHDLVREAAAIRAKVSLTGQYASVDEDLTGTENLVLIARLLGLSWAQARSRARELLDAFELSEAAQRQVRTFSGGMRRRLDIAASLILTPELLFLDEPTTGLDPRSRNQVWEIVRSIAAEGTTVLLTTQYLEEADRLANRLAVIDHGRVIAEGTSKELKASVGGNVLQLRLQHPELLVQAQQLLAQILDSEVHPGGEPGTLSVQIARDELALQALTALGNAGIGIADLSLGQPSLDDVFFALTGHAAEPVNKEQTGQEIKS
ncbi:MAG: ATP-binding cassette domain-containing protein [Pseudomonadales bacterium]